MPLGHLLGFFTEETPELDFVSAVRGGEKGPVLLEKNVALVGIRDIDAWEIQRLGSSQVHVQTMHDIDRHGIGTVMEDAMRQVNPYGDMPLHLSFDIDGCDPSIAPGTGTKKKGGINQREAHYICEVCAQSGNLASMDMVEVNVDKDVYVEERLFGDNPRITSNRATARLAMQLIQCSLGKTIMG